MQRSPDLKDLLNGVGDSTSRVAKQAFKRKTKPLAEQFEPYRERLESLNSDPESVANLIVLTTHELKQSTSTRQELKRLLDTLKVAACSMLRS